DRPFPHCCLAWIQALDQSAARAALPLSSLVFGICDAGDWSSRRRARQLADDASTAAMPSAASRRTRSGATGTALQRFERKQV
ncbi:MAG: Membrane protein insertion efficiency factor YidD, partial [uncultured Lysobacter sp.]